MCDKYNWDLENILQGKTIDELISEWVKILDKQIIMFKDFFSTKQKFINWLKLDEDEEIIVNKISNYIHGKINENISDQYFIGLSQKIAKIGNEYSQKMSDYINIILQNKEKIKNYLGDGKISEYKRAFDLIFSTEKHILSPIENKLLTKISLYNSATSDIFSTLTDNDIKFSDVKDSKNKIHKIITQADVFSNLKKNDRVLRKNTWISFNLAYANFEQTLCKTLYFNYLKLNSYAKLHNFNDYIDRTCFDDEINRNLILNLYHNVEKYKYSYKKFNEISDSLLKKKLKINKIEAWDRNMDITKTEIKFTIQEAKKIVIDVLKIFGDEYLSIIKKALNEQWISFLPKQNKYSGAYSIGSSKGLEKKYILMNFNGTYNSVSTLIHELGHSLNSYFYDKYQKIYSDTTIFTAEISSIVNELLLAEYIIKKNEDSDTTKNFIIELVKDFFATTSRQITFSNFEYEANKLIIYGKPFNCDTIKKIYKEMIYKYQLTPKNKFSSEPYSYSLSTIFRISHFYHGNFYVYKYAIGQIVAINIINKLLSNEDNFINKYIDFLKSGTSKSPIDTIKILGIDLYDNKTYENAINYIDNKIKLLNEEK